MLLILGCGDKILISFFKCSFACKAEPHPISRVRCFEIIKINSLSYWTGIVSIFVIFFYTVPISNRHFSLGSSIISIDFELSIYAIAFYLFLCSHVSPGAFVSCSFSQSILIQLHTQRTFYSQTCVCLTKSTFTTTKRQCTQHTLILFVRHPDYIGMFVWYYIAMRGHTLQHFATNQFFFISRGQTLYAFCNPFTLYTHRIDQVFEASEPKNRSVHFARQSLPKTIPFFWPTIDKCSIQFGLCPYQ